MTRIGRKVIILPVGVSAVLSGSVLTITGPNGSLNLDLVRNIVVSVSDSAISVSTVELDSNRALQGLFRSLIFNMVKGVTSGFYKDLELVGVGYRVSLQGDCLNFSLGYSHPVSFSPPSGVHFVVEGQNKIKVVGIDKQLVGQTVAEIIKLRPPDSYKGKGIRISGSVVKTKAGKSVKK